MIENETILQVALGALTVLGGWLKLDGTKSKRRLTSLETRERTCQKELTAARNDLLDTRESLAAFRDEVRMRDHVRDQAVAMERLQFQNEISRQERDRHQLTYENNRLLVQLVNKDQGASPQLPDARSA